MHFKHLAVAAALVTTLVAVPATAHADTSVGTCAVGVVLPERLAITGYGTAYGARLTGETSCFGHVVWDLSQGLISTGQSVSFYRPTTSGFLTYSGGPRKVHALPAQGAYSFDQFIDPATGAKRSFQVVETASNTMTVKYDSRLAWRTPRRSADRVTLKASVASISINTVVLGTYAAWTGAKVRFQHKQGKTWTTVAIGRADAKGDVRVQVPYWKGEWRVQSADTSTTWGRTSGVHRL